MKKIVLNICISALVFATMEVALKLAGTSLDPLQLTFVRFFLGGIILLPFGFLELRQKQMKLSVRLLMSYLFLGILCVPIGMVMFQYSILHANAATCAVLFCTNPISTTILAHFLNDNDQFTKRKVLAILITIPGIVFMIRPWDMQPGNTLLGALLSISAGIMFSLYGVIGTRTIHKGGPFAQTAFSFLFGSLVLLIVLIVMGRPILSGVTSNLPIVFYTGIIVCGIGYLTYFYAVKFSNATTASIIFLLKPAIAPIIAVIVLHEQITWNMYIGIAFILAATAVRTFLPVPPGPNAGGHTGTRAASLRKNDTKDSPT